MKPIITWALLANARTAKVLSHHGPGKDLIPVGGKSWTAPEAELPRDKPGMGHAIAGPGISAVAQTPKQELADSRFANILVSQLEQDLDAQHFDRLILIAGPHMLGLLRQNLTPSLQAVLLGDIPKDLSHQSVEDIEAHLGDIIAI